ncbi:Peptidoglycan-binding Lysin subgroup [Corchorus olitorius]|uniref:Peptidoglycan-binding Lysin subgroup n=1 Tax=Corchorus olitorius TaxID=93759 RepID=A0A1R3KPC5_9ROSI|nr:Peptidoglycan-binding Lysin subgroup [Corchorus olitorius]
MQHQVVQIPLPVLILIASLILYIFIPIIHSRSTIEPCSSSDSCTSLLHYILPYDSKLSEIAYRFQVNISDILGANNLNPKSLGNEIYEAKSALKVPISCSCVDGIRRYTTATYAVRAADTTDSISEGFGGLVSAEQIETSNGINATNPLISGQSLVIPLPCTCFGNVNNGIPTIYMSYVVKIEDNLASIATEFGTTNKELEAINGLGQPVVNPGDIVSIPISASNCIKCVCGTQDLK